MSEQRDNSYKYDRRNNGQSKWPTNKLMTHVGGSVKKMLYIEQILLLKLLWPLTSRFDKQISMFSCAQKCPMKFWPNYKNSKVNELKFSDNFLTALDGSLGDKYTQCKTNLLVQTYRKCVSISYTKLRISVVRIKPPFV